MISPSSIFEKHCESSYYDQFLTDPDYMKKKYNRVGKIETMTPQQYYEACSKMFHISVDFLKHQRESSPGLKYLEDMANIMKDGNSFYMPYIDPTSEFQEGLHRMYAAAVLFGWNKVKFPVLVVSVADDEVENQNKKREEKRKVDEVYDKVIKSSYYDYDDFLTWLNHYLSSWIDEHSYGDIKNNQLIIKSNGFEFTYSIDDIEVEYE